jgi:hypothetical protein
MSIRLLSFGYLCPEHCFAVELTATTPIFSAKPHGANAERQAPAPPLSVYLEFRSSAYLTKSWVSCFVFKSV